MHYNFTCHPPYAQLPPHPRIAYHPAPQLNLTYHTPSTHLQEPTHRPPTNANIHTNKMNRPSESFTCCPIRPYLKEPYTRLAPRRPTTNKLHSSANCTEIHHHIDPETPDYEHQLCWPPDSSTHGHNHTKPSPASPHKYVDYDTKHMVPKSRSHSAKTEAPINITITNLEPPMMPHLTPKHHPLPKPWTTTHQTCASVQNNHLQTHNDEAPQHRCPQTAANTPEPREALAVQILYYTSIRHPSAPAPAHVGPHNLQEQETSA